jgi:hypothetical protein
MNKILIFVAAVAAIVGPHTIHAASRYVSKSGSDSNPGTQTQPWLTIQKAASSALPGDTVFVQPGDYPERVSSKVSGSSGAPITFKANGAVTVHGFYLNNSFITIDGFDMSENSDVTDWAGAIEVYRGLDTITLINNKIHDWDPSHNKYGIHFNYAIDAATATRNVVISNNILQNLSNVMLSLTASNALVTSNLFNFANTHDAMQCWGANVTIRGNTFTNISSNPNVPDHTDIIQTYGEEPVEAYNIIFENNLVINCDAQLGQLEQGPDFSSWRKIRDWTFRNNIYVNLKMQMNCDLPGTKVYNNLFYRCTRTTSHVIFFGYNQKGYATNSEIKNNIFVECGQDPSNKQFGWYSQENPSVNLAADYNFVCGTSGSQKQIAPPDDGFHWKSWGTEAHGINGGSPQFVNADGYNFHYASGSPFIDRGVSIATFNMDFAGSLRGAGVAWDMGPYESGGSSGTVIVQPPTNLRVVP